MERAGILETDSHLFVSYFTDLVQSYYAVTMEWIANGVEKPLGDVTHHWFTVEFADEPVKGVFPHCHGFVWTTETLVAGESMSSDYDAARARLTACYTCFRNKMKEMKDFDSVSVSDIRNGVKYADPAAQRTTPKTTAEEFEQEV